MLRKYFDKVYMITLRGAEERVQASIQRMLDIGLLENGSDVEVRIGVRGDELPPPAWFRSGNGAWGCLKSHISALEDAWNAGAESVLLLEDDVDWSPWSAEHLPELMACVPQDWGQIYLGGQHRAWPEQIKDSPWIACASVNRTHAYAVNRSVIPKLLAHIQHAPDYMDNHFHIDHQLERAHQRGDWTVYGPKYWLAGQGENDSQINGRWQSRKWWDWDWGERRKTLPLVWVRPDEMDDPDACQLGELHFGWEKHQRTALKSNKHRNIILRNLESILQDAWIERRMVGFVGNEAQAELIAKVWKPGILPYAEVKGQKLEDLVSFTSLGSESPREGN